MKKITLLITSFNSISQLTYTYLKDKGYIVDVVFASSSSRDEEIESFHPGIRGDRGAYSLEYALSKKMLKMDGVI